MSAARVMMRRRYGESKVKERRASLEAFAVP
jgi:hypothetical protein